MKTPRISHADAGDVAICCYDYGGDGRDLLLVHATGFHGRVWEPWMDALTLHHRVCTMDQRGHGDSGKPDVGYEWEHFATDVLAAVSHLGLSRPSGAGHSAGGAALILAESRVPGTFSRLALMDPVLPHEQMLGLMQGEDNPMSRSARRRRAVWDTPEQMIERLQSNSPMADWKPEWLEAYVVHGTAPRPEGGVALKCPPEIEARIYEGGNTHRGGEALAEISCPVLLLAGRDSYMWPEERAASAAERIRDAGFVMVDGGHFFPQENPDLTLAELTGFLET